MTKFNYQDFFTHELAQLHREGRYRVFADLERVAQTNIYAFDHRTGRRVTIWCSNDCLSKAPWRQVTRWHADRPF